MKELVKLMNKEQEIRIYVDICTDGSGHIQASLNIAERLRDHGYNQNITFILGCTLLEVSRAYYSTSIRLNRDFEMYYRKFINLLSKRGRFGYFNILSLDAVDDSEAGAIIRRIINGETWDNIFKEYNSEPIPINDSDKEQSCTTISYEDGEESSFPILPLIKNFQRRIKFGFSGAFDGAGDKVRKLGTELCIALQPKDWDKGIEGIFYKDTYTKFSASTLRKPLCTVDIDKIKPKYLEFKVKEKKDTPLSTLLDIHTRDKKIILLYNPSFMRQTIGHEAFASNIKKCFDRSSDVVYVELFSKGIPSLWSSEDLSPNVFDLDELSEKPLPSNSVIRCTYLPTFACDYLMKKAFVVLCEGQGMAQKALEMGIPCLHRPQNTTRSIYESIETDHSHPETAEEKPEDNASWDDIKLGKDRLKDITSMLSTHALDDSMKHVPRPLNLSFFLESSPVRAFCEYAKSQQGKPTDDRLIRAMKEADFMLMAEVLRDDALIPLGMCSTRYVSSFTKY